MSRLRSNQPPVAFECDQLTEVLSHAQRELEEYDTAIARLHSMIVSLENDKRSLNRQVHLTRSLMAPIRKLPPEILRQIFIEHGVENVIRSKSSAIPGLKIASVCSYWRSVAFHTTELWNNISHGGVSWGTKVQWHPSHVSLVKTLLELSQTSPLSITLDFREFPATSRIVPPGLLLLCEHADRWQSLAGYCSGPVSLEVLSSVEGRLHNLRTFRFMCPVQSCSALLRGASKLHTLATSSGSMREASIPWNQILHLQVKYLAPLQILDLLAVSPDLRTLVVGSFSSRSDERPVGPRPRFRHPNLTLLDIILGSVIDAAGMEWLLESMDLPNLKSFSIMSPDEQYDQWQVAYGSHRSNQLLLPLLLCSSTITTFTLHRIWVSTNNLIVLLQRMPSLSSFLMSDPDFRDPTKSLPSMLNDDFLLNISGHSYHDRQPLLTRLISLSLEGLVHDSFSMHVFVDVIQSRWSPSPIEDEVTCIRTVKLSVRKGCIDPAVVHPLTILEKHGLDVVVKDQDGDVLARNQIPG